jgi:serine/threonine protein kinase/tetratricopeptide (TPR) repeat protein
MTGDTASHYHIGDRVGAGGMGVVYKAEDTRLKRTVALKFLHPELTRNEEAKLRFIQEAQAAAALNHPHICTIYEIDEHDSRSFIAMEFIEGENLKERIQKGPLPVEDILSITIQIGEGLHEAHQKGIVHRDIKPGNIMLTQKGQAKILDFGLALLGAQAPNTRIDTTLGTAAYMSPEQAGGKEVDRRSDIWSLGVMLYEMITGTRPFTGEYEQAVMYSILHDEPAPITALRSHVPMDLERIVDKALAKNTAERYQHIEDMLLDLRALGSATPSREMTRKTALKSGREKAAVIVAAVIFLVFLGVAILLRIFSWTTSRQKPVADARKMVVVLPFENLGSPEDEYFANGTTDAITARLACISGLGVISRQSAMQYKKTLKSVRQIGNELGVGYLLEGTVQREKPGDPASRVRVIPQLIRVADDTHVWAATYDESMTEVFRVQSDIAERVAVQLDIALLEPERRAIEKRPTENLAAYENFLWGIDCMNNTVVSDVEKSIGLFEKAVSLDPQFAEAWALLAAAHRNLYWAFDRPGELALLIEAAQRAQQLAPDSPETQIALGYVAYSQREFDRALEQFEKADRQQPSGETAQAIGFTLRRMGRWQEALDYGGKARRLLPRSAFIYSDLLAGTRQGLRQYDQARQDADHAIRLSPEVADAHVTKAQVLLAQGDMNAAKAAMLEMLRSIEIAEAAEYALPQGLTVWVASTYLRLLPETFAMAFNAFEAGPISRYRSMQPAMIASCHLGRAFIHESAGDRSSARARYDSARICFERVVRSNPQSAYIPVYHSDLGLAYAGLDRCEEAIRKGEEAVQMIPISTDAVVGAALIGNLAEIYVKCGKYEAAIDQLGIWLSVPSGISAALLRLDPIWDPLRSDPRFRRLVEGK